MKHKQFFLDLYASGKYVPTKDGQVISYCRQDPKILKPKIANKKRKTSHAIYGFRHNGVKVWALAHQFIWLYFNQDANTDGLVINHIDNNPINNSLENLEMVTPSENTLHAVRQGRMKGNLKTYGELSAKAKITNKQASFIKQNKGIISYAEMARTFNVAPNTIWYIANGLTFKNVT